MSQPAPLQNSFARMIQDVPRDMLPKGAVWNAVDQIPMELGAALEGRGAWAYSSPTASKTNLQMVAYADFIAGGQLVEVANDGTLYSVASSVSKTSKGTVGTNIKGSPFMHRDKLIIPSSGEYPSYYNGTAVTSMSATGAPQAVYGTVWLDYSVLARTSANPTTIYFSNPGDPLTWDTANAFQNTSHPITGIVAIKNAILIFSLGHVERLRGSIPPQSGGTDGGDLVLEPLFEFGCIDSRSIAAYGDYVVWANPQGIWMTDGAVPQDLTQATGIKSLWLSTMASYLNSNLIFVAGIIRNKYIITLYDTNASAFRDGFVIDLQAKTCITRITNVPARMMASTTGVAEELYFASQATDRSGALSGLFSPGNSNYQDGNGTNVTPYVELPFYRLGAMGKERWKNLYVTYDLRDPASTNPILTVSYITSPESTSYTALSTTCAESTTQTRKKIPMGFDSRGLGLKVAQTNGAGANRLYALEADVFPEEPSK